METAFKREPSSFRDPSGYVFERSGVIYRSINKVYTPHYNKLMQSGLYEKLVSSGALTPHTETPPDGFAQDVPFFNPEKIIQPLEIPFISYPYEWCFEQYRDAALLTLEIQRAALEYGMTLKDASAYNVQFIKCRPVFIDTLSFETFIEGPWPAYAQFCRHFFAPLALMALADERLGKLMQNYIDGVPLDLAASLLRGKGGFGVWQHIHLHAQAAARFANGGPSVKNSENTAQKALDAPVKLKKETLSAIAFSLSRSIKALKPRKKTTEWGDYYSATNYNEKAAEQKAAIVDECLQKCASFKTVWDMGANDGRYSRLALKYGAAVTAFDIDFQAVRRNYERAREGGENLLPLLLDLTAPSPAIGFANVERKTITERRKPDVTLMLALIHHIVISNNIPLQMAAAYAASFSSFLIIEFVPKTDSQARRLLKTRPDVFTEYTQESFEKEFSFYFSMELKKQIENTERTMYLFRRKTTD
ncbi:MAG: class I SAM-dependent methyltransferase [Spirochaetaceae bacterium]|jgi:hypothetical protein|nr:class I SAM-dependent methyltransferase [Spirochaetaceae bacterium]